MAKSITISAKITPEQKLDLDKRAKDSNMSINEYIKGRLFYDIDNNQNKEPISEIVKRNYLMGCKIYALLQNLSLNTIKDPKTIEEIEKFAIDNAKEKNLLPSDHPLMKE